MRGRMAARRRCVILDMGSLEDVVITTYLAMCGKPFVAGAVPLVGVEPSPAASGSDTT